MIDENVTGANHPIPAGFFQEFEKQRTIPQKLLSILVRLERRILWPHPNAYILATFGLKRRANAVFPFHYSLRRRALFSDNYDLLVDGFKRSANTYASVAFRLSQPNLRVRCHCHNPMYVIQSVRWGKPVCVLVRNPVAAISSFVIHSRRNFSSAIEDYIDYYRTLIPYRRNILIVSFDQVTNDFRGVVRAVNSRYGIGLKLPEINEEFKNKIFEGIQSLPWGHDPLTVSMPNPERSRLLTEANFILKASIYKERIQLAQTLYDIFLADAATE